MKDKNSEKENKMLGKRILNQNPIGFSHKQNKISEKDAVS